MLATLKQKMEEFDINKVIAEFLTSTAGEILSSGKDAIEGTIEKVQLKLKTVYTDYLKRVYERYGKSKSFFIRDEPVNLYEFYIPLGLECNKIKIKSANLKGVLNVNHCCIISGTGGAGKSIILKHLFIDCLKLKKQVPIFIELRDLNSKELNLEELIKITTKNFGLKISEKHFETALEKGHFILFLDGLDEVVKSKKDFLLKEINELTIKYPKTSVLLTTRPDIKLTELDIFSTFKTLPLSLEKSISLVKKLPADEELKSKFIEDLKNGLYIKHQSFLSNPLLLSIMMLTYGYSSDIPSKSSVFYNQAFDALFQRHDSFKGAYKRKRETNLDIQEFSKVFSTFCILTYEQRLFKFSKKEVIDYLHQCKKITSIDFNPEDYLTDLLQAVSLLIEDGMSLYFTHRSFQEYFSAKFIVESEKELKLKLFEKYQKYANSDKVFQLAREMDRDFIDFEVVKPFLEYLFDEISLKKNVGITNYIKFIKLNWERFEFKNGQLYGIVKDQKINEMFYFILYSVCPELLEKEIDNNDKSDYVVRKKKETEGTDEIVVFETSKLKTTDTFTKELFKNGVLFSKTPLKILVKTNKSIAERKETVEKSLTELLFEK